MKVVDALAIALIAGAGAAFFAGEIAIAHTEDLRAVYWLVVGIVSVRAGVQIARPGARR
jgi:hypothetical protein